MTTTSFTVELDLYDLANEVAEKIGAEGVAENIEVANVANEIDLDDLATYIDTDYMAGAVDLGDLADEIVNRLGRDDLAAAAAARVADVRSDVDLAERIARLESTVATQRDTIDRLLRMIGGHASSTVLEVNTLLSTLV